MANDVEELLKWMEDDNAIPRTISDAAFQPDRLLTLSSRLSAAYKGINVLVLREGAKDFFWKANIRELDADEVALDIHHIFPRDWCEKREAPIPRKVYDSIINKTPISYKANRMIGGVAPSKYLTKLQEHKQVLIDDTKMDELLISHKIPVQALRADDFETFFEHRKLALLDLIAKTMGKQMSTE